MDAAGIITGVRPMLAVLCCGSVDSGRPVQRVTERVLSSIAESGAAAVMIPAIPSLVDVRAVAARFDGLVLTGGPSNVDPGLYGGGPTRGEMERGRDEVAMALAAAMIAAGRPVLGICRGMQELAVLHGGALVDLDDPHAVHMKGDWRCPSAIDHVHPVELVGGILLGMSGSPVVDVSSVHAQGVGRMPSCAVVEAVAHDGLVEAFSVRERSLVLGVQWHPERARSSLDARIFQALARAA